MQLDALRNSKENLSDKEQYADRLLQRLNNQMEQKEKDKLKKRKGKIKIKNNLDLGSGFDRQFKTFNRLYLTDENQNTYMELTGNTNFKPKQQKSYKFFKDMGFNIIKTLKYGTNKIVFYELKREYDTKFTMRIKGGLHDIDFTIENKQKFALDMLAGLGFTPHYKHKNNGGWDVHIPKVHYKKRKKKKE